jgi:hypothetical protein
VAAEGDDAVMDAERDGVEGIAIENLVIFQLLPEFVLEHFVGIVGPATSIRLRTAVTPLALCTRFSASALYP